MSIWKDLLLPEIEDKRQQLNNLFEKEGYLLSEDLLARSQELDELIIRYVNLSLKLELQNTSLKRCAFVGNEKEFILYGLDSFDQILVEVSDYIKGAVDEFDLQLILSEALSNAFIHGNKQDRSKPITLRLKSESNLIKFEIEDAGINLKGFNIPDEIPEENILNDHGRGLFLLKSFTDSINFENNTLFLTKNVASLENG